MSTGTYLSTVLSTERTEVRVSSAGVTGAVSSQIWMSVRGWGWILGVGSCVPDLGSGIGGGDGG